MEAIKRGIRRLMRWAGVALVMLSTAHAIGQTCSPVGYRMAWGGPVYSTPNEPCEHWKDGEEQRFPQFRWASYYRPPHVPFTNGFLTQYGWCEKFSSASSGFGHDTTWIVQLVQPCPRSIAVAPGTGIARPGTAAITAVATVAGGSTVAGVGVSLSQEGGAGGRFNLTAASTNGTGQVTLVYTPPSRLVGAARMDKATLSCDGCAGSASFEVNVLATPAVPTQSCTPGQYTQRPIALTTGVKLLHESDWVDLAPHPLTLVRHYASAWTETPGAGLGAHWNHSHAHHLFGVLSTSLRTVQFGDGTVSRFTNASAVGSPPQWQAAGSQDSMEDTAEGVVLVRAQDDSRWVFHPATGKVMSAKQRNGWTYVFTYTGEFLTRISNAFGRSLAFTYDAEGRLRTAIAPDGTVVTYAHDGVSRLVQVSHADGSNKAYLYEDPRFPGALTGTLDEAGQRRHSVTYDDMGRAIASELSGGVDRSTVAYMAGGTSVTDALGQTRSYQYQTMTGQADGLETSSASAPASSGDARAAWSYDANGLVELETDFLGVSTRFAWEPGRRLPLEITRAAQTSQARTTSLEWHPALRLPVRIQEDGRIRSFVYDARGNLLSHTVTDGAGAIARTWQWAWGRMGCRSR